MIYIISMNNNIKYYKLNGGGKTLDNIVNIIHTLNNIKKSNQNIDNVLLDKYISNLTNLFDSSDPKTTLKTAEDVDNMLDKLRTKFQQILIKENSEILLNKISLNKLGNNNFNPYALSFDFDKVIFKYIDFIDNNDAFKLYINENINNPEAYDVMIKNINNKNLEILKNIELIDTNKLYVELNLLKKQLKPSFKLTDFEFKKQIDNNTIIKLDLQYLYNSKITMLKTKNKKYRSTLSEFAKSQSLGKKESSDLLKHDDYVKILKMLNEIVNINDSYKKSYDKIISYIDDIKNIKIKENDITLFMPEIIKIDLVDNEKKLTNKLNNGKIELYVRQSQLYTDVINMINSEMNIINTINDNESIFVTDIEHIKLHRMINMINTVKHHISQTTYKIKKIVINELYEKILSTNGNNGYEDFRKNISIVTDIIYKKKLNEILDNIKDNHNVNRYLYRTKIKNDIDIMLNGKYVIDYNNINATIEEINLQVLYNDPIKIKELENNVAKNEESILIIEKILSQMATSGNKYMNKIIDDNLNILTQKLINLNKKLNEQFNYISNDDNILKTIDNPMTGGDIEYNKDEFINRIDNAMKKRIAIIESLRIMSNNSDNLKKTFYVMYNSLHEYVKLNQILCYYYIYEYTIKKKIVNVIEIEPYLEKKQIDEYNDIIKKLQYDMDNKVEKYFNKYHRHTIYICNELLSYIMPLYSEDNKYLDVLMSHKFVDIIILIQFVDMVKRHYK